MQLPPKPATCQTLVEEMLRGVSAGAEEPFYVIDLNAATERLAHWRALLPDVEPFYAAKCNGDPALLLTLAHAGVGFDCASQAEIKAALELGVPASRLLYANPIKQPSHLRYAAQHGVNLTVFDGADELHKLAEVHPSCALLLRIAVDDSGAQCILSNKYGAPMSEVDSLLCLAADLGLRVVGVSFHVGSGSSSADAFQDAVARAAEVFASAAAQGRPMTLLDVGGGFPGTDTPDVSFRVMAASLRDALDKHFPRSRGVRIIAEPGRFFASATHTLAANVIGRKVVRVKGGEQAGGEQPGGEQERINYYINDGLYGSFNCVLYDHASPACEVLPTGTAASADAERLSSCVWGPTCDGIDCVISGAELPRLSVGSWLYFRDMGAYTACAGSNFNGMALPSVLYLQARGHDRKPRPPDRAAAAMIAQLREEGVTAAPEGAR